MENLILPNGLKPCPICGQKAMRITDSALPTFKFGVTCWGPGCPVIPSSSYFASRAQADEAWNAPRFYEDAPLTAVDTEKARELWESLGRLRSALHRTIALASPSPQVEE